MVVKPFRLGRVQRCLRRPRLDRERDAGGEPAAGGGDRDDIGKEPLRAEILDDLAPKSGAEAILLVNGFGGTPSMELYLMCNAANRILSGLGVKPVRTLVGSYVTSLDMAGASVTLLKVDDELLSLWDAPVNTAALRWGI